MKIRIKYPVLLLSAMCVATLVASPHGSWMTFLATAWLLMILPGYMILSLLPLSDHFPTIYKAPLSFALSMAFYLVPMTILCSMNSLWETVYRVGIIQNGVLALLYLVFAKKEISVRGLVDKAKIFLAKENRRRLISVALSIALVGAAVIGTRFVHIQDDSVYHTGRINQLNHDTRVSNNFYITRILPFAGPDDLAAPEDAYKPLMGGALGNYEFGYYFATIAGFNRTTRLNTLEFQFLFTKLLFVLTILSFLLLGWVLFKDSEYQVVLAGVIVLSFIILKNYFNVAKLGDLPYFFVDNFHPTTIVQIFFMPTILALVMVLFTQRLESKSAWAYWICIGLLVVTTLFIDKIGIVYLGLWITAILVVRALSNPGKLKKRLLIIFGLMVAIVGIYVLCGVITGSFKDFLENYFTYLENTFFKLYYFPLSFIAMLALFFIWDKEDTKTPAFLFLAAGLLAFAFLMLPGVNYLVIKYLGSFIQRVFFFVSIELITTIFLVKLSREFQAKRFTNLFLAFIALSTILTLGLDVYRKGNQKYLWDGGARYSFNDYIDKNMTTDTKYLADFNTETELNATSKLHSLTFNIYQNDYVKKQGDKSNFQTRLNSFLYRGSEKTVFERAIQEKGIEYLILGEKEYYDSPIQQLGSGVFNPDFQKAYDQDSKYSKVFDDGYHCIYRINKPAIQKK